MCFCKPVFLFAQDDIIKGMEQAGAKLTSVAQLACELQCDWARKETAPIMVKALTDVGAFMEF